MILEILQTEIHKHSRIKLCKMLGIACVSDGHLGNRAYHCLYTDALSGPKMVVDVEKSVIAGVSGVDWLKHRTAHERTR